MQRAGAHRTLVGSTRSSPMNRTRSNAPARVVELKGRLLPLTTATILAPDAEAIAAQLSRYARQMAAAIQGMPVVLDGVAFDGTPGLVQQMRELGMQPLAALDGPLADAARLAGLPILPSDAISDLSRAPAASSEPPVVEVRPAAQAAAAPATAASGGVSKPARIITEPVRSGQQIYAEGSDLILLGPVSVGAEVIADGCVHCYGRLSGRAIAGARGDNNARVFVRRHEAELLAVAGIYMTAEQMDAGLKNKPVQVWLDNGRLKIDVMDA